jgi:hypothetical protein
LAAIEAPGGAGEDHGVELVLGHVGVHAALLGGQEVHGARRLIFKLAQIALGRLGGEEEVLAEAQRLLGVGFVEGDDIAHGPDLGVGRPVAQVEVEVALQLVENTIGGVADCPCCG